jgi:hypothetical protein
MNKTINLYECHVMTKDGHVSYRDYRAHNRREAARIMHCSLDEVRCVRANVRRSLDEIKLHHLVTQDPATCRIHLCRSTEPDGRSRRQRSNNKKASRS